MSEQTGQSNLYEIMYKHTSYLIHPNYLEVNDYLKIDVRDTIVDDLPNDKGVNDAMLFSNDCFLQLLGKVQDYYKLDQLNKLTKLRLKLKEVA